MSASRAPPPTRARLAAGSTWTELSRLRSIIRPSSQTAVPAGLCAPPRTDISSPCSRANLTAVATSAAELQRAITDGLRSIPAFHTRRRSSNSASPGRMTGPSIAARSSPMPSLTVCVIPLSPSTGSP